MQSQFTSISNRGILLSKTIISLAIIATVIFALTLSFMIFLSFNLDYFLTKTSRTLLVAFSLFPLFISLYVFYIYESIYPNRSFSNSVFIKLSFFLLYLLIPTLGIIYRYEGFFSKFLSYINLIPVILLILSPFIDSKRIDIFRIIKEVLFTTWKSTPFTINTSYFSNAQITNNRKLEYLNPETLKVFQDSFIKCSNEATIISQRILSTKYLKNKTIRNILDIGGYDGKFSTKLLSQLDINKPNITVIDPIYQEVYENNIKSAFNDEAQITKIKKPFEDFVKEKEVKFDLIIASHSLYSILDESENDFESLVNKILQLLDNKGLVLAIFGSSNSPAYNYKMDITRFILNFSNKDVSSEKFIQRLQKISNIHFSIINIDNYIDLTELMSNDILFAKWTSYFARIPIIKDSYLIKQMKRLALYYSVKANELPNCVEIDRNSNNDYLLHKTTGILISTTANNVYSA